MITLESMLDFCDALERKMLDKDVRSQVELKRGKIDKSTYNVVCISGRGEREVYSVNSNTHQWMRVYYGT